jgi:Domain of unknown function (DUF6371)
MENLVFDNRARRNIKECPCGRSNKDGKFCPYKGYEDKGYCHSCGQTFLPNTPNNNDAWRQSDEWKKIYTPSVKEPTLIDTTMVKSTMQRYDENNFVLFLKTYFHNDLAVLRDIINRFSIGTAKGNKTIFWQQDKTGNYRTGQIILYNPLTGKRNKDIRPNWTHSVLELQGFNLEQCFYGEYQLAYESKPVAIVEAAKTAAIMTAIEPRYTWIATGGAANLKTEKCKVLQGKNIVLYPDLGQNPNTGRTYFEEWTKRAKDIKQDLGLNVRVSDLLEKYVSQLPENEKDTHINSGFDIADYAIKFDWYGEARKQPTKTLPLSKDEQILQSMVKAQPLVKNLIAGLGLVNVKTMRPFASI